MRRRAAEDPEDAERLLFRFRVLDPAMGSGHFLVDALEVITEVVEQFLATTPLPPLRDRLDALRAEVGASLDAADDAQLLKRLLLKHCIYGVDLQEMAVELARVALWLASFVPGITLAYLDQNLKQGDSLVGVATLGVVLGSSGGRRAAGALWAQPGGPLDRAIAEAGDIATQIADLADRTKEEVEQSRALRDRLEARVAGVRRVFALWTAEPFGLKGARAELDRADEIIEGSVRDRHAQDLLTRAAEEAAKRRFFHWPLEFPAVFHRANERNPGFDAVIGNPPWDNFLVDELAFYALHYPGLLGLSTAEERTARVERLLIAHPELRDEFVRTRSAVAEQREFFRRENGYEAQGAGHLDLYELFCERYQALGRNNGRVGVVLPRTTFLLAGSRAFRQWMFANCEVHRLDFIQNTRQWAFPIHPQNPTISLLAFGLRPPADDAELETTGPSQDVVEFERAISQFGSVVPLRILEQWTQERDKSGAIPASTWEVPLLPSGGYVRAFSLMRRGPRLPVWESTHGSIFPVQGDLNETTHKLVFRHQEGVPVWKGRSFDQYDPHGRQPAGYAEWAELLRFVQQRRTSRASNYRARFSAAVLANETTHPINMARLVFRRITNRTNSRTVIACIAPPRTGLADTAPYLVFPRDQPVYVAYALGVLNSLPFDWQARRYVETHLDFFVLHLLCFPPDEATDIEAIATRAARLSCVDERFEEFAAATGVECGPLPQPERERLRAEIDALVAHGYGLTPDDLEVVFADFTRDAVPDAYRELVREKFAEFAKTAAAS